MSPELKHVLIIFGALACLLIILIIAAYAPKKSVENSNNKSYDIGIMNKIGNYIDKFNSIADYIKHNYTSIQKIFLILIILNFSFGIFFLFQYEILGEHKDSVKSLSAELVDNHYETRANSDVIIGSYVTGLDDIPIYYSCLPKGCYIYKGLTYQEILLSLFIGLFLFFCIKIL